MSSRLCAVPMTCALNEAVSIQKFDLFKPPSHSHLNSHSASAPLSQKMAVLLQQRPHAQSPQLTSTPAPAIKTAARLLSPNSSVAQNLSRALNAVAVVAPPPYRSGLMAGASALALWSAHQAPPPLRFQATDPWPLNEGSRIQPNGPTSHVHPGAASNQNQLEGRLAEVPRASGAVPGRRIDHAPTPLGGFEAAPSPRAHDLILMSSDGSGPDRKLVSVHHVTGENSSVAIRPDGSFSTLSTLTDGAFGNGVLNGQLNTDQVTVNNIDLRPQGYDAEYLIEGVSGDRTEAFQRYIRSARARQHEQAMIESTFMRLGQQGRVNQATVALPFDAKVGANSSSSATLIDALQALAGPQMNAADAAYYLDNQMRDTLAQLPLSQSMQKFGLALDRVETQMNEGMVKLTFRAPSLGQGIADHPSAPW